MKFFKKIKYDTQNDEFNHDITAYDLERAFYNIVYQCTGKERMKEMNRFSDYIEFAWDNSKLTIKEYTHLKALVLSYSEDID